MCLNDEDIYEKAMLCTMNMVGVISVSILLCLDSPKLNILLEHVPHLLSELQELLLRTISEDLSLSEISML